AMATKGAGFLLLVLVCAVPALAGVSIPDWVHQAASQTLATYPSDTDAVVLLDSSEYTVNSASEYVEHHRRIVKILRPEGREEGYFGIYLAKDHKLLSARAWSIDASGHEYELKDKDFVEVAPYSFELYSDVHFRSAKTPGSQPGSVVALEYEAR